MAGFLYFIEGQSQLPTESQLVELGLGHLVGCALGTNPANKGPNDSGAGLIFAVDGAVHPIMLVPDKQKWIKTDKYAVGYYVDMIPCRDDLLSGANWPGHAVMMNDGNDWIIPPFRYLPNFLEYDPAQGQLMRQPLKKYQPMAKQVERLWLDYFYDTGIDENYQKPQDHESFTESQQLQLCADFLAINYRVGIIELGLLQLLGDKQMELSLKAILDLPRLVAASQKKTLAGD
ncbi:MAG: hypothetical protein JEZ07_06495 [Phycisphaerae bacterium]|nr:hypothetical protein [Phycisphaerae bacterium]